MQWDDITESSPWYLCFWYDVWCDVKNFFDRSFVCSHTVRIMQYYDAYSTNHNDVPLPGMKPYHILRVRKVGNKAFNDIHLQFIMSVRSSNYSFLSIFTKVMWTFLYFNCSKCNYSISSLCWIWKSNFQVCFEWNFQQLQNIKYFFCFYYLLN